MISGGRPFRGALESSASWFDPEEDLKLIPHSSAVQVIKDQPRQPYSPQPQPIKGELTALRYVSKQEEVEDNETTV